MKKTGRVGGFVERFEVQNYKMAHSGKPETLRYSLISEVVEDFRLNTDEEDELNALNYGDSCQIDLDGGQSIIVHRVADFGNAQGNPTRRGVGYQQWKAGKAKCNPWVDKREPNVHKRRSYDYVPTKTKRTISNVFAVVYVYHRVFDHVKVYRSNDAAKKEFARLKKTAYNEDYDSLHLLQLGSSDLRHVKSTKKGDKWFMVIFIFGGVEVTHIIPFTTKKAALGYQSSIMKEQRLDYDDLRLVQVTVQ
jgi:hypothetical protein